jgi:hypothetical protein
MQRIAIAIVSVVLFPVAGFSAEAESTKKTEGYRSVVPSYPSYTDVPTEDWIPNAKNPKWDPTLLRNEEVKTTPPDIVMHDYVKKLSREDLERLAMTLDSMVFEKSCRITRLEKQLQEAAGAPKKLEVSEPTIPRPLVVVMIVVILLLFLLLLRGTGVKKA